MTNAEKYCRELWARIVKHRDRWCILCGRTDNIQAHHLFNKSQGNWTIIYDVDYGVTLCKFHHAPTPKGSELFEKVVGRIRVTDEIRADKILAQANKPIVPCVFPFDAKIVKQILRKQWEEICNYNWMDADIEPGPGDPLYVPPIIGVDMIKKRNEILERNHNVKEKENGRGSGEN